MIIPAALVRNSLLRMYERQDFGGVSPIHLGDKRGVWMGLR